MSKRAGGQSGFLINAVMQAAVLAGLAGCAIADEPQLRIGSLPYPGLFTNHEYADPQRLGTHSYNGWSALASGDGEASVGMVYTRKAGFIDIAHVRHGMDWTRFVAMRVQEAMHKQKGEIVIESMEATPFRITFTYPEDWWHIERRERDRIIREMSIRVGQRVSYEMTLWHEMLTWYDYGVTLIIPEKGSAFTYEDMVSNMLGSLIAGDVLRIPGKNYDRTASEMLDAWLQRLEVTSSDDAKLRTDAVKDLWWKDGKTLKRYVATGHDGQPLTGWLVRLDGEDAVEPEPLSLPDYVMPDGRDLSSMVKVEIDADDFIAEELRNLFDPPRRYIHPDSDFPFIMARIRGEMIEIEGDGVDDPAVATTKPGEISSPATATR